ncbi:SRPBCC family protein [Nocardia sp. NEAU-G5]|uniref:SRPBCC family protein n=1 Tax=Nocardia albiluteola TaxID=2842303 RepID=A0ABS6B989_9NOCA|nr:SRPBCC family protein [Nocardia albiluteola]MBU3065788.1 SRPBCC family protein [Nocardia albiluteola]
MYPVRIIAVDIERSFDDVADFLADPGNFPRWATGLSSGIEPGSQSAGARPGEWIAAAPEGTAFVRFSPPNEYGVADHQVRFPDGTVVDIPVRAMRNGDGTTIAFTLFRLPDMDDERFDSDSDWVRRDLDALKALLEK